MATAGYSGTPLYKKLGYKEQNRVSLIQAPDHYGSLLDELPFPVEWVNEEDEAIDLVHMFVQGKMEFERFLLASKQRIRQTGMIWVSWPKKASKVPTELTEDYIREFVLGHGLVDVKVCAVDEVWSGLKLVIPVKSRTS